MRRLLFLLSLLATLSATPLRFCEAADDLARALAELDHGATLNEVDGGVGDDSGATIRATELRLTIATDVLEFPPACLNATSMPDRAVLLTRDSSPSCAATSATRRQAALQCYLC